VHLYKIIICQTHRLDSSSLEQKLISASLHNNILEQCRHRKSEEEDFSKFMQFTIYSELCNYRAIDETENLF